MRRRRGRSEKERGRREDHERASTGEEEEELRMASKEEEGDVECLESDSRAAFSSQDVCLFNSGLQSPASLPRTSFSNGLLHPPLLFMNKKEDEEEKEREVFSPDPREDNGKRDVSLKKKEITMIEEDFERDERCAVVFLRKLDELTQYTVKGLIQWRDGISGEEEEEEERSLLHPSSSSLMSYSPLTLTPVSPVLLSCQPSSSFFFSSSEKDPSKKDRRGGRRRRKERELRHPLAATALITTFSIMLDDMRVSLSACRLLEKRRKEREIYLNMKLQNFSRILPQRRSHLEKDQDQEEEEEKRERHEREKKILEMEMVRDEDIVMGENEGREEMSIEGGEEDEEKMTDITLEKIEGQDG
ncbi:hypothetical protein CSUI_006981, partial [Cystoisospora suis]